MIALWLAAALAAPPMDGAVSAHDGGCPSAATLLPMAQKGGLSGPMRTCLTAVDPATPAARVARLALFDDAVANGHVDPIAGTAVLNDVGTADVGPDDALWIAERAAQVDPAFARLAIDRAIATGDRWIDPAARDDRLRRIDAVLAAVDPPRVGHVALPPPALPAADELIACHDVGRLWTRVLWGKGYATERDCVARAMLVAPEADRPALAALATALAAAYGDATAARAIEAAAAPAARAAPNSPK